jgi:hypothetical protein
MATKSPNESIREFVKRKDSSLDSERTVHSFDQSSRADIWPAEMDALILQRCANVSEQFGVGLQVRFVIAFMSEGKLKYFVRFAPKSRISFKVLIE